MSPCADPERVGIGVTDRYTLQNHKAIGSHYNTGPDPLANHKATKPAFNAGPSPAHLRNAILMAFRWRVDYALLCAIWIISSSLVN